MEDQKLIDHQAQQIQVLREEKDAALEALDLASSLRVFLSSSESESLQTLLLGDICARASQMVAFKTTAIYLVDENTQDFILSYVGTEGPDAHKLEQEVQELIKDQSFAFAIQSGKLTFYLDSSRSKYIALHVLQTPSRVHGMFAGLLAVNKDDILDITLKLFSVVMLASAHALENFIIHNFMRKHNSELEKQVEFRTQELQELGERLQITIDGMQAGVTLIDLSTKKIVYANRMALKMIGASKDDIIGKQCHGCICPSSQEGCPLQGKNFEVDNFECTLQTKDGRELPILKSASKIKIKDKEHLVESFVDISQQKKFATLKEDVERIMRHDLKTPLNGIIGLPDIMLMDEGLSSTHREYLEYIKSSGYKLLNMINLSHDLYKMELGTYDYQPTSHDLLSSVRLVVSDLMDRVASKKLTVTLYLDEKEVDDNTHFKIMCEELLVYSMLSNLITNAVDASPTEERVSINIQRFPDEFILSIHNQGAIPEQIRETFFEKYVTGGKVGGTGFGTYSALLIAETMGGTIYFTTSEEDGTTIFVKMPHET